MQNPEKGHEPKDLDLTFASRGVWLVKVPKYLSERWQKAKASSDVGKLRITRSKFPGQKTEVAFNLNEQLASINTGTGKVPQEHKFTMTALRTQNLVVMSQLGVYVKKESGGVVTKEVVGEKLAVEGKVIQRAECIPINNDSYRTLKKKQWILQNQPKREVKQIDTIVQSYKPVSHHPAQLENEKKKKEEGKRSRADRDQVLDMLFSAFEKHQYYNVKDLVKITKQPVPYLKEILKEICSYNMKAPHRNMWELKPEYRHYKQSAPPT
ncbi:general transcription factor IIF subunit 2-like [Gigantopelta aegis]|uniref:general transcription factor IIF subunit 2-like n=1 Tax=Gigantopelta aegis TaxID=1735272 RepID=UPI001B887459|nr:general transcription factor IIF subunit 2-like [Gigantopelta aegis]